MRIDLTDNNIGQPDSTVFHTKDVAAIFPIANKTISELCRENENLLIFPYSIEMSDDRVGDASVISIQHTSNPDNVRIVTNNVMGFIGVGDLQIKIQSRFDKGRDDFLLHYMLQRVMSFNLFDLNHNNEQEDVFDFLMFMFPYFLKSAMRQGIYREYCDYRHNDANIKGTLDIGRHISRNIPFVGNFAYSTREYSYDNSTTELIRHTIEFMKTKKYGQSVLNIDRETKENVESIIEHTPLYNRNERSGIINKNLRMRTHPYYTEYQPLQSLCLQILRMEEVKYGESEDLICGILFDGAWLWEEYVNKVLDGLGFIHAENKKRTNPIYIYEGCRGQRYPDFYKEDFVLDAKYKRIGSYDKVTKIAEEDQNQVLVYGTSINAKKGGFVAPLTQKQSIIPTEYFKTTNFALSIYGIEICKTAKSYGEFCKKMKENEKTFIESLKNLPNSSLQ